MILGRVGDVALGQVRRALEHREPGGSWGQGAAPNGEPHGFSADDLQFAPIRNGIRPEIVLPGLNHFHLTASDRELPHKEGLEGG